MPTAASAEHGPYRWSPPGTNACDTVFLLGSGINANSWVPVIRAAQEFWFHAQFTTGEQVNFWMAWWIYHLRLADLRRRRTDLPPLSEEVLRARAMDDINLRQTIAASLRVATEHCDFFRLRRGFTRVLHQRQWGRAVSYLTTNWDRNLEVELSLDGHVTHIHGDVADPRFLYLPTETGTEPYRTDEVNDYIGRLTGSIWQVIRDARQVCIYGLSLSPLDAELTAALGVGLGEHTGGRALPVWVYNLAGKDLEEAVWRVRTVAPHANLDIRPMEVEPEPQPEPVVPEGWDLHPR